MKSTIKIENDQQLSLLQTIKSLIENVSEEIPMLKKSITEVPNSNLANDISLNFASVPLALRLAILDLSIIFKLHLESVDEIEDNLLLRLLSGQLYEFSQDVPKMFGKKYRLLLEMFPDSENLKIDLNTNLIKEFNEIKARHVDFLKVIRHNVSHHKDEDALLQYHIINEVDFNWAVKAYIDFTSWFTKYSEFEKKLIDIAVEQEAKRI